MIIMSQIIFGCLLTFAVVMFVKTCIKKNKTPGISEEQKKKNRKVATIEVVISVLFVSFAVGQVSMQEEQKKAVENQKIEQENQIKFNADKLMISQEYYQEIQDLFKICGLGTIKDVIFNGTFENENLFIIKIDGRESNGDNLILVIDNKTEKVKSITLNNVLIYENGDIKHVAQKYDFYMNDFEKIECMSAVKEYIKSQLKAPSTAKFPKTIQEYQWGRNGDIDIAVGWVESQNSFGVPIITNFKAYINRKDNTFNVEFLN